MDLDHVRSFVAVVDEGGFRRAAVALGLSQPTVSRHVVSLEDTLGRPVCTRGPEGVTLTPAGELFLDYARSLLATEQEARRLVSWGSEDPGAGRTACRIGIVEGAAAGLTRPLLRGLGRRLPRLELHLVPVPLAAFTGTVPPDLDLLLGRDPWDEVAVDLTVLFLDPVVLVAPPSSELASAGSVTLEEALRQTLVGIEGHVWEPLARYWTLAEHGEPRLRHAGISPARVAQIFRTTGTCGVAPLSALSGLRHLAGPFCALPIRDLAPNRSCLASRAGDHRRSVHEVHRVARRLAAELVPLVLPREVALPQDVAPGSSDRGNGSPG